MSIRKRVAVTTAAALAAAILVLFFALRATTLRGFTNVETDIVERDIERALGALEGEISTLERTATDWGQWDDTYRFVKEGNAEYVASNLLEATFADNELTVITIYGTDGVLVHGARYDAADEEFATLPEGFAALSPGHPLAVHAKDMGDNVSGIWAEGDDLYAVAAVQILTSRVEGPPRGTLVMARAIDASLVERIREVVRLDVAVRLLPELQAGRDIRTLLAESPAPAALVDLVNDDLAAGYGTTPALNASEPVVVSFEEPRTVVSEAQRATWGILAAVALLGAVLIGLVLLLMNRLVLSRLQVLGRSVRDMSDRPDATGRVTIDGNDELADLADDVNEMLAGLERARGRTEASEARYRELAEHAPDVVYRLEVSDEPRVTYLSSAIEAVTGHSADEFDRDPALAGQFIAPADMTQLVKGLEDASDAEITRTLSAGHRDGRTVWLEHRAKIGDVQDGKVVIEGIARDVTERKRLEDELEFRALHDPLTGLANRVLFLEELGDAIERLEDDGATAAVLFLDLDRFKYVNDSLGHSVGDRLLQAAAAKLHECVRPADRVARFGGDEYAILLDALATPTEAESVAARILDMLSEPIDLDRHRSATTTGSIGIAFATGPDDDPEDLLARADTAMYRAKDLGRARYELYDEALRAEAVNRLSLEQDLRAALRRDQLQIVYQPEIDLSTGKVRAFEALLRWAHPELGVLEADHFVILAEETGLIVPIGIWVLEAACAQLAAWQRLPNHQQLRIGVNLSARQLGQGNIVAQVERILDDSGCEPAGLSLEITETALMADPDSAHEHLERLSTLGVHLSIDDFGTGYSSLAYLRRFPIDSVKIDRTFVSGLGTTPEDAAIVESIITLGHTLGLEVVAEGVETPGQLEMLRVYGCDLAQGFHIAVPKPASVWEDLVSRDVDLPWRVPPSSDR